MIEKMMDPNIIDYYIINCAIPSIITIKNRYQIDFGKPEYRQGQTGVKIRLEFLGFNINCFFTGLKYIGMDDLVNCSNCGETFHILSKSDPRLEQHLKYVKREKKSS